LLPVFHPLLSASWSPLLWACGPLVSAWVKPSRGLEKSATWFKKFWRLAEYVRAFSRCFLLGVFFMKRNFNSVVALAQRGYDKASDMAQWANSKVTTVVLLGVVGAQSAMAQAADPFDAAVATATTKVTSYAGALVGLAAVAVVFMIAIKYVKRIPKAS
jgi:hypothetical protein